MVRFVGKTLVAWMVAQGLAPDKETAVRMGQGQLQRGYILSSGYQFQDASIFYQLCQVFALISRVNTPSFPAMLQPPMKPDL